MYLSEVALIPRRMGPLGTHPTLPWLPQSTGGVLVPVSAYDLYHWTVLLWSFMAGMYAAELLLYRLERKAYP